MEYVNKRRQIFLSLSKLGCGLQEINSREIRLHLTFSANWNKLDRVSKKSEFILKVAFSLPLPWSMLKLPIKRSRQREYCFTIIICGLHVLINSILFYIILFLTRGAQNYGYVLTAVFLKN